MFSFECQFDLFHDKFPCTSIRSWLRRCRKELSLLTRRTRPQSPIQVEPQSPIQVELQSPIQVELQSLIQVELPSPIQFRVTDCQVHHGFSVSLWGTKKGGVHDFLHGSRDFCLSIVFFHHYQQLFTVTFVFQDLLWSWTRLKMWSTATTTTTTKVILKLRDSWLPFFSIKIFLVSLTPRFVRLCRAAVSAVLRIQTSLTAIIGIQI